MVHVVDVDYSAHSLYIPHTYQLTVAHSDSEDS